MTTGTQSDLSAHAFMASSDRPLTSRESELCPAIRTALPPIDGRKPEPTTEQRRDAGFARQVARIAGAV